MPLFTHTKPESSGLETFKEFPPRQKPGSFSLDQALARMNEVASRAGR
jgi:hypothetical protein